MVIRRGPNRNRIENSFNSVFVVIYFIKKNQPDSDSGSYRLDWGVEQYGSNKHERNEITTMIVYHQSD